MPPSFQPLARLPRLSLLRELCYLAFVAMELCIIVPWYRALTPFSAGTPLWVAFGLLGLMMLAPLYTARVMNYLDIRLRLRRRVLAGLLVVALLAGLRLLLYRGGLSGFGELFTRPIRAFSDVLQVIPDEMVVFLVVLLIWWRGVRLSAVHLSPRRATFGLFVGFFVFVAFFFMISLLTGETPGPLLPLFFFAALAAIGLTRVETLRRLRGARLPFGGGWLAFLLGTAALTVGLGGLLGMALSGGLQPALVGLLTLVVLVPLVIIATPLAYAALLLLRALARALGNLRLDFAPALDALSDLLDGLRQLGERLGDVAGLPLASLLSRLPPARLVGMILLLALGAMAVVFALRRLGRREAVGQADERESLFSASALLASLRQWWAGRLSRLGEAGDLLGKFGLSGELFAALTIRRMYLRVLRLAAEAGFPRAPAETPLEYLPALGQAFPGQGGGAEALTRAYVRVRYGELPEGEAERQELRQAFEAICAQAAGQTRQRGRRPPPAG